MGICMNLFHDVWGLNWGDSKAGEDAIAGVWDDWKTQLCVWCLDGEEDQDCWSYLWPLPVAWASSQHGCLRMDVSYGSSGFQGQIDKGEATSPFMTHYFCHSPLIGTFTTHPDSRGRDADPYSDERSIKEFGDRFLSCQR